MILAVIIVVLLTLTIMCMQIHTMRQVRALKQRFTHATETRRAYREGTKDLRERLDKRFGILVKK